MRNNNIEFKKIRRIESKINRNLYIICGVVTIVTMVMLCLEFFTCGFFSMVRIEFFYLGVLIIYSLHKEFLRWFEENKIEHQGEYFVYAWIGLTTLLFIINFLTNGRFYYVLGCDTAGTLKDASLVTIEVLGVFISTRLFKMLKIFLVK
jgi:hypothetical protein